MKSHIFPHAEHHEGDGGAGTVSTYGLHEDRMSCSFPICIEYWRVVRPSYPNFVSNNLYASRNLDGRTDWKTFGGDVHVQMPQVARWSTRRSWRFLMKQHALTSSMCRGILVTATSRLTGNYSPGPPLPPLYSNGLRIILQWLMIILVKKTPKK